MLAARGLMNISLKKKIPTTMYYFIKPTALFWLSRNRNFTFACENTSFANLFSTQAEQLNKGSRNC